MIFLLLLSNCNGSSSLMSTTKSSDIRRKNESAFDDTELFNQKNGTGISKKGRGIRKLSSEDRITDDWLIINHEDAKGWDGEKYAKVDLISKLEFYAKQKANTVIENRVKKVIDRIENLTAEDAENWIKSTAKKYSSRVSNKSGKSKQEIAVEAAVIAEKRYEEWKAAIKQHRINLNDSREMFNIFEEWQKDEGSTTDTFTKRDLEEFINDYDDEDWGQEDNNTVFGNTFEQWKRAVKLYKYESYINTEKEGWEYFNNWLEETGQTGSYLDEDLFYNFYQENYAGRE